MNKQSAQKEAIESNIVELFDARNAFQNEINQRGMDVLRAIGYEPFKWEEVRVALSKRGKVDIVTVSAKFEQMHTSNDVTHEFSVKQFEYFLRRDHSA
jgi:hypothetical protein